ncbi:hypothetical protein J4772_11555 [Cohnella sp. LGH]|uniref:hypothetical protein n=1 Tax=Cohnella sp. LGH TaxID=1619153 RepID=UPI001AD99D2B|nr:hypothetical protein [Cohnella sp. LGH]QTH44974.1 hypothetical protein J4772_11555 [Cohnella sp. LGH]
MKEAAKIDLDGLYAESVIAPLSQSGVTEIRELLPAEDDEEPEEVITGYIVAEKVPNGLFTPRWDFTMWADYQTALADAQAAYDQALADWYALPEEERGERPTYIDPIRPECWVEGMPPEEIEAIRNAPQPISETEHLRTENLELKLALAELAEAQQTDKLDVQLALAELAEIITGGA